jgi:hypothetical protein
MSIARDAKSYAGIAVEQGKQAFSQAQTLANQAYSDLRTKGDELLASARQGDVKLPPGLDADKINAVKARITPLVSQALSQAAVIGGAVTDKADELRKDPRLAKAVSSAESVANGVHEHLVQPVLNRAGFMSAPAKAAKKPTGTKPAQTKPAQTTPAETTPAPAAAATGQVPQPATGPTLHSVKPTKAGARAPRKTTAAAPAPESDREAE